MMRGGFTVPSSARHPAEGGAGIALRQAEKAGSDASACNGGQVSPDPSPSRASRRRAVSSLDAEGADDHAAPRVSLGGRTADRVGSYRREEPLPRVRRDDGDRRRQQIAYRLLRTPPRVREMPVTGVRPLPRYGLRERSSPMVASRVTCGVFRMLQRSRMAALMRSAWIALVASERAVSVERCRGGGREGDPVVAPRTGPHLLRVALLWPARQRGALSRGFRATSPRDPPAAPAAA
jgi:hypothetical protein